MNKENLKLVYVDRVGKNSLGLYEYDFFFSSEPENVYGEDWGETCPSACGDLKPDDSMYELVKRLKTYIPLMCAQENNSFSMADCTDHIVSICFERIDEYEAYPEPYRLVFEFGESFDSVEDKLAGRHQFFEDSFEPQDDSEESEGTF